MKTLLIVLVGFSIVSLQAFATDLESSSTPESATTFTYTNNTLQEHFTIPTVVAIISVVAGIAIYVGVRKIKNGVIA